MELEFTEDQEHLRDAVRAVLLGECPPSLVREVVEKGTGADGLWAQMVELDWPGLAVAEEYGGVGFGFAEIAVVAEELGRVTAPGPLLSTVSQFQPAIREMGSPEQAARFLSPLAPGALAIAEDAVGWDVESMATAAARDGHGWRISGSKRFVVDAGTASEIVVIARNGAFVVPRDACRVTPTQMLDATRAVATVELDDVRVDADRALAAPEKLPRALDEAVVALAFETVGACQTIFDLALEHAKTRHQFGVPIGSFQAIKHKMADMYVALEAARATAVFACATIVEDDPRRRLAASMAKVAAGEAQRRIAQDGIQTFGGIGYTWEHDLHLYVKRAKQNDALFGTAGWHRARVAELLGV
jgi:alkylation response protein AidB-like acyl-CoA dehydrogenase